MPDMLGDTLSESSRPRLCGIARPCGPCTARVAPTRSDLLSAAPFSNMAVKAVWVMLDDYISAIWSQWLGAASIALLVAQLVALRFPRTKAFIDRHQGNVRALHFATLGLFLWASFSVYQQDQREILALRINPASVDLRTLPTSPDGLRPGDLWDDGGVLIVTHSPTGR
jgi:hypothetical protein